MPKKIYKVAIIEDEKDLAEIYHMKMKMDKMEATVINDSLQAMETLRKIKPDLVLLDVMMPELDGFELYQQIKADKELKKIKVYLWSNLTQKKDKERAEKLKVDGYLVKSDFTPTTLAMKARDILDGKVSKKDK